MKLQPRRFELPHESMVVRGDQHAGAEPVELDEKTQQAPGHLRVDVTGRLVGEQQLGLPDHRAGDGGSLLFTAR